MTIERARFARDFFLELMKERQRVGGGDPLAERERWLARLAVDGREEVLFEFEMLLRGLERYLDPQGWSLDERATAAGRDFGEELRTVRDALDRAIKLAQLLLDPPSDRRLMFRKYLESLIADDRMRRELLEAGLEQGTPQESLFQLRSGLLALRGVLDHLLRLEGADRFLFADVGQLVRREFTLNRFFKPFRPLEFRPEYDRIKDLRILELVNLLDGEPRRLVTTGFLGLFRLLHYLRYVPAPHQPGRRGRLILTLVSSEAGVLSAFLEGELSEKLARLDPGKSAQAVSAARELRRRAGRVPERFGACCSSASEADVGLARDELAAACRSAIITLARAFEAGFEEGTLRDDATGRREQSSRLRLDLFAYREVCSEAAKRLAERTEEVEAERVLAGLAACVDYFDDVSKQLLRYGDHPPFERFAGMVGEATRLPGALTRRRMVDDCRHFAEVLGRMLESVGRREDLANLPFDETEGRVLAARFLERRSG